MRGLKKQQHLPALRCSSVSTAPTAVCIVQSLQNAGPVTAVAWTCWARACR